MNAQLPLDEAESADPEPTVDSIVSKATYAIEHLLSPGDLASLRRMHMSGAFSPSFWRMLVTYVPDPWTTGPERDEKESRWAGLFMGMAFTVGLHDVRVPLGQALATAGWSELRFVQLMRDRGGSLVERVRRVAIYLASKEQPANWADVAALLLNQEGSWAERHRRRIARAYYQTLYRQTETQSE